MLTMENRFCLQDEEHDPCEEFEEYMACDVCGDHCKYRISLILPKYLIVERVKSRLDDLPVVPKVDDMSNG